MNYKNAFNIVKKKIGKKKAKKIKNHLRFVFEAGEIFGRSEEIMGTIVINDYVSAGYVRSDARSKDIIDPKTGCFNGYRSKLVITDDFQNDENVKLKSQRHKLEDWFNSVVKNNMVHINDDALNISGWMYRTLTEGVRDAKK